MNLASIHAAYADVTGWCPYNMTVLGQTASIQLTKILPVPAVAAVLLLVAVDSLGS